MIRAEIGLKLYKKYAKVTKFLVEVCEVAKGVDSQLSAQEFLKEFDLLLQAILFYQSKSNGAIYPKEQDFFRELADEEDLLKLVKSELAQEDKIEGLDVVEWSNIFECKQELFAIIDEKIGQFAKEYTKNLVAYVALAECLDGKSYFSRLSDEIVDLLYYFAKLENGADDNEVKHGILAYCRFVANYYVEVMSNIEEFFADKNVKKDLLVSLRKSYKDNKRSKRLDFLDRHIKAIKERLSGLFKKDKE